MSKNDHRKRLLALCLSAALIMGIAGCTAEPGSDPQTSAPDSGSTAQAPSPQGGDSGSDTKLDGEIVIGACSDMTGTGASNGKGEANAYQMIADEINAAGGVLGKKLVIRQEDTNGTSEGAVNAINRQFSDPNVVAALGFMYSSHVLAIADIAKEAQRPVLYLCARERHHHDERPKRGAAVRSAGH